MIELIQIIYVLKLYLDSNKNNFAPNYEKGLVRINKLLQDTYSKIQHYYYKYILYPELQYYLHS